MSGQACIQFVQTRKSSKRDVLSSVCLNNLGAPRFDVLCTNTGRNTHGERPKKCNVGHEIAGGKSDGHSAHLMGHSKFKRAGVQQNLQKRGNSHHYGGVIVALLQLVAPERLVRVITHMLKGISDLEYKTGYFRRVPPTMLHKDKAHSVQCCRVLRRRACCVFRCNQRPNRTARRLHHTLSGC
jgi:hypothetical protein